MLGGICFQLVSLIVFIGVAFEYYIRYIYDIPIRRPRNSERRQWGWRMKLFTAALTFILVCILIRSIYRTAELADGWNGRIITTQVYFDVFDASMVLAATFTMNVFHPGYFLQPSADETTDRAIETILLTKNYGKSSSAFTTPNQSSYCV